MPSLARPELRLPIMWPLSLHGFYIWLFLILNIKLTPLMMVRSLAFGGNQGVFWSILPEVQFYGFFILLWFAYYSFRNGNKLWLILCAVLCAVFIMTHKLWGGLMLPSKLHIFLFGFLAAFLLGKAPIKKLLGSIPFQASVTTATILYGMHFIERKEMYNDFLFAGLVSLTIASLSHSTRLAAPLETATMRMLGAVSFSVYLFHEMILHVINDLGLLSQTPTMMIIAVAVIVSLAIPVAFHFLAERHMNAAAKDRMMFYFNSGVVPFFERRKAAKA